MARPSMNREDCKERFYNAVKQLWVMRGAGEDPSISDILRKFKVGTSYTMFLSNITGKEDVNTLCEELYEKTREFNRERNKKAVERSIQRQSEVLVAEAQKKLEQSAQSQKEINLDRLRYEIRTEILKENYDREREQKTRRFYAVASECLYRLVSARPKESSSTLASKAVEIAEKFTQLLDKE